MSDPVPVRPGGLTCLVVPVPEVAPVVGGAHVALLDPFLHVSQIDEGVLAELRGIFADVVPFAFVLTEAARFPTGDPYLPPQPSGAFRRITQTVRRSFPELAGRPASLYSWIPHLAVSEEAAGRIATPLKAHAREALLLLGEGSDRSVLETFVFGTSAA